MPASSAAAPAPRSEGSAGSPDGPGYGSTTRYLGDAGRAYYETFQAPLGEMGARFNRHLWTPYVSSGHDVLDFGCGGGQLLRSLDARRKVGVEINPVARAVAADAGIEMYETVGAVPGVFDRVITSHALEHVPFPQQALVELRGKLRGPESRLVVLLPLEEWRTRHSRTYRADDINQHLYGWTPLTLGNLLASAGLRVYESRVVSHAWSPRFAALWNVSPGLLHAASRVFSRLTKARQLMAVAGLP